MNAQSFFSNSKNVWVSENFQSVFLNNYSPRGDEGLQPSPEFSDLQNISAGKKIQALVFQDPDSFLEQLVVLMEGQINGEEGKLLNDSSANYFFLKAKDGNFYSVLVRWESAQQLWRCGAYLQEELKMPNVRVFYPE